MGIERSALISLKRILLLLLLLLLVFSNAVYKLYDKCSDDQFGQTWNKSEKA